MKAKYILSSLLLASCTFFSSCVDNLDISQHGVSTFESFYKTDADAEEATPVTSFCGEKRGDGIPDIVR